MGYFFVTDNIGLSSFKFLWWALKDVCNARERIIAVKVNSGSSKVVDFGTNQKRVCDLLLVINSNLRLILHCFGDTAVYWSKNRQNRQFVPTPVS